MNLNRLAVFIADFGYDEAGQLLGLDEDLLQKAVAGNSLSEYEVALIDNAYSNLVIYDSDYIDFDIINNTADNLEAALSLGSFDDDTADSFRESFSFGQVDFETFNESWQLFVNLNLNQIEKLVDWLSDNPNSNADEFLIPYLRDGGDIWDDVTESEFWEWFREVFYD